MHKISDPPVRKCPACGKLKLTKQVSASRFRLGGSGWYETDFKKDGKRNLAGERGAGDKAESAAPAAESAKPAGGDKPAEKGADKGKTEKKDPPKKEPAKEPAKTETKKAAKAA